MTSNSKRDKLKTLTNKWSSHTQLEKQAVNVHLNDLICATEQDILVISTHQLTERQKDELLNDYFACLEPYRISTLISHQADPHAFFCINKKLVDLAAWDPTIKRQLRVRDYRLAQRLKIESTFVLRENEFRNLFEYILQIEKDLEKILGGAPPIIEHEGDLIFDFNVKSVKTNLDLNDNKMLDGTYHNCLTWFTSAPVAADKSLLDSLTLPKDSIRIFDIYSWTVAFAKYLLIDLPQNRSPMLVVQSGESLQRILESLKDPDFVGTSMKLSPDP